MLLILSIIVSIKRAYIVIGNVYIELSMIYAVRFRATIFGTTFFKQSSIPRCEKNKNI